MWRGSWYSPIVSVVSICLLWLIPLYACLQIGVLCWRTRSESSDLNCCGLTANPNRIVVVLLQLRCLRRCIMKLACWTSARSEVLGQCSKNWIWWTCLGSPPALEWFFYIYIYKYIHLIVSQQNLADAGLRAWSRLELSILVEVLRDSPCRHSCR